MPISQPSHKKNSSLKTLIIILGVGIGIFAVVLFLGSRSSNTDQPIETGLVTQSSGAQVSAGSLADTQSTARRSDQIVTLLNSVSSIELDDSIFRNPSFTALRDINSSLPLDRNPGRDNPFLPIGQEVTTSTNTVFEETTTPPAPSDISTGESALQDFIGTPAAQ